MKELVSDFLDYLKYLLFDGYQMAFTLFDILGIVLLFSPHLANTVLTNERLVRIIGGCIFLASFLLANFKLYRKFSDRDRQKANIILRSKGNFLNPPSGSVRSPFPNIKESPRGFNNQGLPDWGSVYAEIIIRNIGHEEGWLIWEYDPKRSKFPGLFDLDSAKVGFDPPTNISERRQVGVAFYFNLLFNEHDPESFARKLKRIKDNGENYKIVITYRTERIDSETEPRTLKITGNFDGFIHDIVEYWGGYSHSELCKIVLNN